MTSGHWVLAALCVVLVLGFVLRRRARRATWHWGTGGSAVWPVSSTISHMAITLGPPRPVRVRGLGLDPVRTWRRGATLVLHRHQEPFWAEKGWRREGAAYVGDYLAGARRWRGRVETPYPGAYQAYIWNPPLRELKGNPHRPCFQANGGNGRFEVHFREAPSSLSHAISSIETVLREALGP